MKYIRTKKGKIIKVLREGIDQWGKYGMVDEENCIRDYDDLKQADTIEELCDEFVVIGYKIKDPFIFSKEGISIDDFWKHSPSDTVVYGAIWTEWGLKYVAKMNDKGELELL